MKLFVIDGLDYTAHIIVPTYKVQREPVTKTWEDATFTNHIDFLRWRLKGSFKIYFETVDQFNYFMDKLETMRDTDFYTPASFYDNDTRTLKESKYYIKITIPNDKPYYGMKKHDAYDIQIEEK